MVYFPLSSALALVIASASASTLPSNDVAATIESRQVDCTGSNAVSIKCCTNELPYSRDFFHIGGRMVGTSLVDQIYVEKLTPRRKTKTKAKPLVFVHGGGVAGSTWLNTPDNRPGFASYFTKLGYVVYLVDAAAIGRSSENNLANFTMIAGTTPANVALGFTNVKAGNTYPQSQLHTQWPGEGVPGDIVFNNFASSFIPLTSSFVAQETAVRAAGCKLLSML